MKRYIQVALVEGNDRYDNTANKNWETVAEGLEDFLEWLNNTDDEVNKEYFRKDVWFRIMEEDNNGAIEYINL